MQWEYYMIIISADIAICEEAVELTMMSVRCTDSVSHNNNNTKKKKKILTCAERRRFYGAPSGIHSTLLCSCSTMVMIWVQM